MKITKKLLEGKKKELVKKPQDLTTHNDITIIGDLMWEKESKVMNWDDAMQYAENLRLGGYDDWKLPTIKELGEVVHLCGGIPVSSDDGSGEEVRDKNKANAMYQDSYQAKGFASHYFYYWSSTTYTHYSGSAWIMDFSDGKQSYNGKSFTNYVRCVRSGQ